MVAPVNSGESSANELRKSADFPQRSAILRGRAMAVMVVLICCVGVLAARLFYIQVIRSGDYAQRSRSQLQQRGVLWARRGCIRDCRGRIMAHSIDRRLDAAAEKHSAKSVSHGGLSRVYPFGELAGTVLGYVGKDGDGLAGVEYAFDDHLRGENGWEILQRDGRNIRYSRIGLPRREPIDGKDVWLTIDIEMQRIAQTALNQAVADLRAKAGMCMIIDPSTGAIAAMADAPSFNPNNPSSYPLAARMNRCIGSTYEPGSTFKVVTAAAALQEGALGADDVLDGNNGVYRIYDTVIRDRKPFGRSTFAEALTVSCNICFVHIAEKLGGGRFYKYVKNFGFGAQSGLELPGEERGIVKPVAEWSARTGPTMAIGQEISVTFLQMMMAFACVANDGILVAPHIVQKMDLHSGTPVASAQCRPVRRVLSESTARTLRAMMRNVVDQGTGKQAAIEGVPVAGKTGTSQKIDSATGGYSMTRYWSSFIGLMPVDKPILVCGVVIDEPLAGETGGAAAAPAFRRIVTEILSRPDLDYAERILPHGYRTGDSLVQTCRADAGEHQSGDDQLGVDSAHQPVRQNFAAATPGQSEDWSIGSIGVPDCVGRDIRDAAAALLRRGMIPYVTGLGVVAAQSVSAGSMIKPAQVCTLYCEQKG